MATGQALCDLARQFLAVRPWDSLEEDDLIFVEDLAHPDPHVCSVMGARGEFHSLTAYLGPKGYYLFRRLLTAESPATANRASW